MSYNEFYNDYKNDSLDNIIFLYGEENYLLKWAKEQIIEKYVEPANREFDIVEFYDENVSIDDVISNALNYSMFSNKRVIVVRNFKPFYHKEPGAVEASIKDTLNELVSKNNDTAIIVFLLDNNCSKSMTALAKNFAKKTSSYNLTRLRRGELEGFISKRIKGYNKFITSRSMDVLIDSSGYFYKDSEYTLDDIFNDVTKLCNSTDETEITPALIEDIMIGEDERFVFDFIDALVSGRKDRAMMLAVNNIRRDQGKSLQITGLLIKQFEMMYDSLELSASGKTISEMTKALGVNEFRFKKAFSAARKFSKAEMIRMISELYDIDKKIKTGTMDKDTALELFVAGI